MPDSSHCPQLTRQASRSALGRGVSVVESFCLREVDGRRRGVRCAGSRKQLNFHAILDGRDWFRIPARVSEPLTRTAHSQMGNL